MTLNTAVMFSKASDEWSTPEATYAALDAEFHFDLDCAATPENRKCPRWLGPGSAQPDALSVSWEAPRCWLNPPYSRVRDFMAKAAAEAQRGCMVVALVPARTDTRWWHAHVWDGAAHAPRPEVEVRFLSGRLKFGGMPSGAPFPSVVVIFRPTQRTDGDSMPTDPLEPLESAEDLRNDSGSAITTHEPGVRACRHCDAATPAEWDPTLQHFHCPTCSATWRPYSAHGPNLPVSSRETPG